VQTITFYAYKGGTGRTLALANGAKYLARLGQRVFAIDLDLEAPGLHHKLRLNASNSVPPITQGVVDCIHAFTKEGRIPEKVQPFTVEIPGEEERDGKIVLMPAGNIVTSSYWRRLAALNWHDLFYKEGAEGIPFFLELKERIDEEFSPDFLLIDARTGITEMGGVATTILPDQVVCLLLNNRENLEGAREVLRAISRVSSQRKTTIGIVPVLARLPLVRRADSEIENRIAEEVRGFLCEDAQDVKTNLRLPEVLVLHAEESLAYEEALRIGGKKTVDESPLLRDYLRLFAKIIPNERVEPHLDRLIGAAIKSLLEKPDRVQSELEALAIYCPHPTSYLALLKFYRLRNAAPSKILQTAVRFWELSRQSDHPLLREAVIEYFKPERRPQAETVPGLVDFVQTVWQTTKDLNADIGLRLVDQLLMYHNKERAMEVMQKLLSVSEPAPQTIIGCITRLIESDAYRQAHSLIEQWASSLADNTEFQSAWALLIVSQSDVAGARRLFESKEFRPASVLAKQPHVYVRLLMLANRKEELDAAVESVFEKALASGDMDQLIQAGRIFDELGTFQTFRSRLKKVLPEHMWERIMKMMPRTRRVLRPFPRSEELF
jgi:MinD-like ATPase involved in chromosome partitioning or flagellar assembly